MDLISRKKKKLLTTCPWGTENIAKTGDFKFRTHRDGSASKGFVKWLRDEAGVGSGQAPNEMVQKFNLGGGSVAAMDTSYNLDGDHLLKCLPPGAKACGQNKGGVFNKRNFLSEVFFAPLTGATGDMKENWYQISGEKYDVSCARYRCFCDHGTGLGNCNFGTRWKRGYCKKCDQRGPYGRWTLNTAVKVCIKKCTCPFWTPKDSYGKPSGPRRQVGADLTPELMKSMRCPKNGGKACQGANPTEKPCALGFHWEGTGGISGICKPNQCKCVPVGGSEDRDRHGEDLDLAAPECPEDGAYGCKKCYLGYTLCVLVIPIVHLHASFSC